MLYHIAVGVFRHQLSELGTFSPPRLCRSSPNSLESTSRAAGNPRGHPDFGLDFLMASSLLDFRKVLVSGFFRSGHTLRFKKMLQKSRKNWSDWVQSSGLLGGFPLRVPPRMTLGISMGNPRVPGKPSGIPQFFRNVQLILVLVLGAWWFWALWRILYNFRVRQVGRFEYVYICLEKWKIDLPKHQAVLLLWNM